MRKVVVLLYAAALLVVAGVSHGEDGDGDDHGERLRSERNGDCCW